MFPTDSMFPVDVWEYGGEDDVIAPCFGWYPKYVEGRGVAQFYWTDETGIQLARAVCVTGDATAYAALLDWMRENSTSAHSSTHTLQTAATKARINQQVVALLENSPSANLSKFR